MKRLQGYTLADYQHPMDKGALLNLKKVPVLNQACEYLTSKIEQVIEINRMGSGLRVTRQSYPEIYDEFEEVARTLNIKDLPDLYIQWGYDLYTTTDGDAHPITIINSGVIDLLTKGERKFSFGHELGHIAANHLQYLMLCRYWKMIDNFIPGSSVLGYPLLCWSRRTDFTADRMGLLACQDIDVAISTMMKRAGVPIKFFDTVKSQAFNQQIAGFDEMRSSMMTGAIEKAETMGNDMPWIINRASYLIDWYKNGEYNTLMERYGV